MTTSTAFSGSRGRHLGGRLPLLEPSQLDGRQRVLHDAVTDARGRGSYDVVDGEGRLIGPFNAFLRVPAIAEPQLAWAQAISASGIPPQVRDAVILTIAGLWESSYMLYAHRITAAAAGLDPEIVARLSAGSELDDDGHDADDLDRDGDVALAATLTRRLVTRRHVPGDLYERCVDRFGEAGLVAVAALIGQYSATVALLDLFDVPAPE